MLDFDKDTADALEVKFKGETYSVEHPTVGQIERLQEAMKDNEGREISVLLGFLESCGLPKDVGRKMSSAQLEKISNALNNVKKN